MKEEKIYLDNGATTKVISQAVDAMLKSMTEDYGNPSSLHALGVKAERGLKEARNTMGWLMQVPSSHIVFTSGGTESNNLAIFGSLRAGKRYGNHCITTEIEHSSLLNTFGYLEDRGYDVTYLPVNSQGSIDMDALKNAIREDTVLISMAHVNNEIGTIQPINDIGLFLKTEHPKVTFHVDAVQSFGRLPIKPLDWGIDLLSISGHKIHGPKGVGVLYANDRVKLHPLQFGGGQEGGVRSGTENLPGIMGLARAAEWTFERMDKDPEYLYRLKLRLADGIVREIPEAVFNGPDPKDGAPHILNLSIPGVRGETLLHVLESHGVFVSTGSACSSRGPRISHVLAAIGATEKLAEGAIRISLSYLNKEEEIDKVPLILKESIERVKRFTRR